MVESAECSNVRRFVAISDAVHYFFGDHAGVLDMIMNQRETESALISRPADIDDLRSRRGVAALLIVLIAHRSVAGALSESIAFRRQLEIERRALALLTGRSDRTGMSLNDLATDGQTETGGTLAARGLARGA